MSAEVHAMSKMVSMLQENRLFPPTEQFVKQANVSGMPAYKAFAMKPSATSRASGAGSPKSISRGTSRLPRCWTSRIRRSSSGSPTASSTLRTTVSTAI